MTITPINAAAAASLHRVSQQPLDLATLELRQRTMVVEASAGTGKTTAIATLTVRALGEGFCTIDQVMLVTFTVKAAAELRTRVHGKLTETLDIIGRGGELPEELAPSYQRDPEEFRTNLQQAASQFDRATITTTHSFCQMMLMALGIHVDHDPSDTQTDTLATLKSEITDDLFLQYLADIPRGPDRQAMQRLVDAALDRERVALFETAGTDRTTLATTARQEFERRKRTRQVYGFDDMTHRLAQALANDGRGEPGTARSILTAQYRLVMVDEFQDTDQQQWQLVHDAFHGSTLLVLIGDPKQSIYRFRGADVQAYVSAAQHHEQFSLHKNYRSTRAVLSGIEAVLNNAQLGHAIQTPSGTADAAQGLVEAPGEWIHPVQVRILGTNAHLGKYMFDGAVADLVAQTRELFDNPPQVHLPRAEVRRLRRRDVAVLVRSKWKSDKVASALNAAGIPAVQAGSDGVFKGEAGQAWATMLELLLNVTDGALRRAALTPLLGWDIPQLIEADDTAVDDLARVVRELSQLWLDSGFAVMSDALFSAFSVHERLLQRPQGMQLLSDLLQVAEMAHDHALSHRASPEAVRRWLVEQTLPGAPDVSSRVGSDVDAIQVMTMHSAKGLGFPVVLLPDLFEPVGVKIAADEPRLRHDPTGQPLLDVSATAGVGNDDEAFQEELRLAYVAMTRAQVAVRLWWGASQDVHASSLHRLLVNAERFGTPGVVGQLSPKGQVDAMLEHLSGPRFRAINAYRVPKEGPGHHGGGGTVAEAPLGAARPWTRSIDRTWRRTSYSGLTAALHELGPQHAGPIGAELDRGSGEGGLDEPDLLDTAEVSVDRGEPAVMVSPMDGIPGGAEFGSLVHAILEHVDPQAHDLHEAITRASAPYLSAFGPEVDAERLVSALVTVFHSPLGSLTGGTLADLPASDRLAELDFELTMGAASGFGTVADLAALFSNRDLLPAEDPLAHYGQVLAATPAAEQTLHGFLNGSIDAVLRVGSGDDLRFVVVDYKTNMMPLLPDEALTVQHYGAAAMTDAMVAAHYPLQALLYSVALHRVLGWRLPGYDPEVHLGGAGYLFVRGMAGPRTPDIGGMPAGVFTWRPPARFILAADKILGGSR